MFDGGPGTWWIADNWLMITPETADIPGLPKDPHAILFHSQ
jgi:hypothetical protein